MEHNGLKAWTISDLLSTLEGDSLAYGTHFMCGHTAIVSEESPHAQTRWEGELRAVGLRGGRRGKGEALPTLEIIKLGEIGESPGISTRGRGEDH